MPEQASKNSQPSLEYEDPRKRAVVKSVRALLIGGKDYFRWFCAATFRKASASARLVEVATSFPAASVIAGKPAGFASEAPG